MDVFEYLGVIISVIMGLGVTHILAGVSKTIHQRSTVKLYWVQMLWALNVLIFIVTIWWGMFWWSGQQEWAYFQFLLLILYAILLFLAASLIFPWDVPEGFDFEQHFDSTRPWFFCVLMAAWCLDIPETLLKATIELRGLPTAYLGFVLPQVLLSAIGAIWANTTFHKLYAVLWPLYTLGYMSLTTLAQIAA